MPENFDKLFNDAKLIQHFENYMERESIEIKNDKYLQIEIRKSCKSKCYRTINVY